MPSPDRVRRAPPDEAWIARRVEEFTGRPLDGRPVVFRDTTHFMSIDWNHIVDLDGRLFLVRGHEKEGRFGIQDQPKFWVKRAIALENGERLILKMVHQETFRIQIGEREILCCRSAEKEARVLEAVKGHPRFMQGETIADERGNPVRVVKLIDGVDLLSMLRSTTMPHRQYFETAFPAIFSEMLGCLRGLQHLHECGLCHGDIRNDHILCDRESGTYRWIDFDLFEESFDLDVWSVGNLLHCVVAKGFLTFKEALQHDPALSGRFDRDDASVFFPNRIMNLRKAYPYVPASLNDVLMRFAVGARVRFASVRDVIEELADWNGREA